MNALDQAFIKAFAKDRDPTATRQAPQRCRAVAQPPDEGVQSVALVLHDVSQQGKRLRIDRPTADAGGMAGLAAHMVLPSVEHVESYRMEDVQADSPPPVVFEDHLVSLDPIDNLQTETQTETRQRRRQRRRQRQWRAIAMPCQQGASRLSRKMWRQSPTSRSAGMREDTEVPTLARTLADGGDGGRELRASSGLAAADEIEARLLAECQPRVLMAAPELQAPELMTLELMTLAADRSDAGSAAVSAALTAVEVDLPHVDLELLEAAAAAHPGAIEDRRVREEAGELPAADAEQDTGDVSIPVERIADVADTAEATITLPPAELESAVAAAMERRRLEPFTSAWEVDAFRWPELCQQLDEQTGGKLRQSGEELFVATGDGLKVLVVSSTSRREGRSTLALALAQNAARAGSHVALLDADAGNPELAHRLGLESPCDWYEVALRGQSLCEAAVTSLEDGVTLFPLTCPNDELSGVQDQVLARTLGELSRYFDLVVVDLPPTAALPKGRGSADLPCPIDMAVVIRNVQTTPQDLTLTTVSTLRNLGVRAVGVIENFAPSHGAEGDE